MPKKRLVKRKTAVTCESQDEGYSHHDGLRILASLIARRYLSDARAKYKARVEPDVKDNGERR